MTTIQTTESTTVKRRATDRLLTATVIGTALLAAACGANEQILQSGKGTPAPPAASQSAQSSLDEDITAMRTADFRFIWVLRRKDGGILDAADKNVIRANTVDMNRRVLTDADKAVIVGSNALPPKPNIDALFNYFAVQDLSPEPMPTAPESPSSNRVK